MLLVALVLVFVAIAATRPGPNPLFRGRYRSKKEPRPLEPAETSAPGRTPDLRDPSRRP